ncbi:required for excision 1-B domain-containing protein isoform X1 [Peromyscus californicus insignis]|uniref:required for excision 1-B domain-containing protein isoform X1 n=1 Tax=Peromyscus californicus insignis TaxID=564181 RepID=UPI0022A78733|nr:required for excision 1-B domain-containing protein isoform X1 [Peromyscus californicus insignis]
MQSPGTNHSKEFKGSQMRARRSWASRPAGGAAAVPKRRWIAQSCSPPRQRCRLLRTPPDLRSRRGPGAHRQYLLSGQHHDFPRYRSVVHEVTQVFAAASREVLAVEAELAGPRAQLMLARHVRRLQELEQTRLATVALLQVMGTPGVSEQEDPEKLRQLKIKVIKTMEAISEVLQELRFDAESAE